MPRVNRSISKAVRSDLTFMRGNEQLHGKETLGAIAVASARRLEDALAADDALAATRWARELRAALAAIGQPGDANDDGAWVKDLSTPVGHPPEP